jgi:hypothetical protein
MLDERDLEVFSWRVGSISVGRFTRPRLSLGRNTRPLLANQRLTMNTERHIERIVAYAISATSLAMSSAPPAFKIAMARNYIPPSTNHEIILA